MIVQLIGKGLSSNIARLATILLLSAGFYNHLWAAETDKAKCLYVSSYHKGYAWSDGVEEGIRSGLAGKCELRQFDMDTKRKKTPADKTAAALEAKALIESWQPDVVITSDDNAAKHLIVPFYKDSSIPFIFNGINWTVEEYGFPFNNVTGIVEVAPIKAMLKKAVEFSSGKSAVYLGANTLTEEKNFSRIHAGAEKLGISLTKILVSNYAEWQEAFKASQANDFLVMGSNSGIDGWDEEDAGDFAARHSDVISVTNHAWMMHVTVMGFTKIPQEHGEWAAEAAVAVLEGTAVSDIPIVTNRKWDLWINDVLVDSTGANLPANFRRKAKKLALSEK